MKIIHTADWHIGKILHRQDLYEDISFFFDWLVEYIKSENIDLLLVSGDIFDLANPSNRDTRLYYQMLYKLSLTDTKVIITGGNHDSISLLDAPSALLDVLNIHIISGARQIISEELIPYYDKNKTLQCVILAVPFLRDKDLRSAVQASEIGDKSAQTSAAIKNHYDQLVLEARNIYGPNVPLIAMGHLFVHGSLTSDGEREIHVGNLEGLEAKIIPSEISYMALGHIHKPQRIAKKDHIRYSGSPVFLDFSEREYEKMIIKIELDNHSIQNIQQVMIPKVRDILKKAGSLAEIKHFIETYSKTYPLQTLLELEICEPKMDITIIHEAEDMLQSFESDDLKILKHKFSFGNTEKADKIFLTESRSIEELTPIDILNKKLEETNMDTEQKKVLVSAYNMILESLND